jgi:succinyl-diaminopimelate desuccinylase
MKNKIKDLTKNLVKYKSTHDRPDEKQAVLDFVYNWFKERSFELEKFEHETCPSLLVFLPGQTNKNVLMMAHLDVVSAPDHMFEVKIEDNIMRGRGVLDNKGMAAMIMLLVEKLKTSENRLPNIKFLFTTDEEIGGHDGAEKLSKLEHLKNTDFIFVPDGGQHDKIVCKEKGVIGLELEIVGKSAHSAKPWLADNPIEKAFILYQKISSIFPEEEKNAPGHWHSTVSLTKISAGNELNKIPEAAQLGLNIRFTENYNLDELINKINTCLDESVKILKIKTKPCLISDENHIYIKNYQKIAEEILKKPVNIRPNHGASDAVHFMHLNAPIVLHRAEGEGLHADDEWVNISSIEQIINGLEKFLVNFK